jgi:hypothetical protein
MNSRKNSINLAQSGTVILALALVSVCQYAAAQSGINTFYNPPAVISGKTVVIPAGTTFEGRIESTIGSSTSKQGERFVIEISSPVLANASDVLIPAGAEILGEVVEAIPANRVPHKKHEKPPGKLRIQITILKMPDGSTFPMVASLVGESSGGKHNPNLGGGMAYAGSSNSFEAVSPSRMNAPASRRRGRSPLHVVTKQELMKDPILGKDSNNDRFADQYAIRSLIKKKRDLYIYQGSPLSVHLDAPFKMGIGVARSAASSLEAPVRQTSEDSFEGGHRRFSPNSAAPEPPSTPPLPSNTTGGAGLSPTSPAPNAVVKPLPFQVPASKVDAPATQSNSQDSNF